MFIFKPVLKEDELKDVPFEGGRAKHGGTAWGFLFTVKLTTLTRVIGPQAACVSRISLRNRISLFKQKATYSSDSVTGLCFCFQGGLGYVPSPIFRRKGFFSPLFGLPGKPHTLHAKPPLCA